MEINHGENRHKDHGFTLIELNLVVASVGMLTDSCAAVIQALLNAIENHSNVG
jgi:Tfp pilus assembly protein PilE